MLLEFYYQIGLHEFCNFGEIEFDEPIKLIDILQPLYDKNEDLIPMEKVIDAIFHMKDMFKEYFQIVIDDDKQLTTLPMLLVELNPISINYHI